MNFKRLAKELEGCEPEEILRQALESFPKIAISFSGAEDVVLVDMATRIDPKVAVFSLDTGRLHPETYRYFEVVRERYGLKLELLSPDAVAVDTLVRNKGLFSFYQDGHQECCAIRKVGPLRRKLAHLDAWITGQRRDQSLGTRAALPEVQEDRAFSTAEHPVIKFNPLANWSSARLWEYIHAHDVPFNDLHARGFISIGCEPCTRPTLPNQHEREGRWWWEDEGGKECGLHGGNLKTTAKS